MKSSAAELFGRERELAAISALAKGTAAPAALLLEAEPGMGKTTLWRHGQSVARESGIRVLASSPASGETQLSFAALTDVLGATLPGISARMPAPQRRALEVALLLDTPGEQAEQRTVLAATLTALRLLADDGPVLLAVDDLQWVDEASVEALAFAVRRLADARLSILATRRVESNRTQRLPFVDALEQRHGDALQRVSVRPLNADSLHDVIRERLGTTFPHSVMERIASASGGNPFYALELARALTDQATPIEPGTSLPLPTSLRESVRRRLSGLSRTAQELLAVVSALSDPKPSTIEAAGVADAVDEALRAGVLEYDASGRLRFEHPLLASGATTLLPPPARRRMHARLAALVGGEERARHLALSAEGPSEEVSVALHQAAEQAAGRGAIGAAAELAEQALRLTPPDLRETVQRRMLEAAGYELRHGDTARARAHLEPLLEELPAGPTRAGVLLGLARLREQDAARALELCHQAIAEAGPRDVRAAEAHQLAAEMSMLSGDIPTALDHAALACQLAEAAGEQAVLIESLGTLCHYQTYTGAIEPGLLERAVELEQHQPRPSNNYSPREIYGLRLMYGDRLDEARGLLEASYDTAEELGDELDRGALLIHLTQLECRAGNYARAEERARETGVVHQQARWQTPSALFTAALAGGYLGHVDSSREYAVEGARLAAQGGNQVFRVLNMWSLGLLELSLGNFEAAHAALADVPAMVDQMGYRNPGVRPVHGDAIEARIAVGEPGAEAMIDDLAERAAAFDHPTILGMAERMPRPPCFVRWRPGRGTRTLRARPDPARAIAPAARARPYAAGDGRDPPPREEAA